MRTLISSILVLGLSAQPILAQQTLLKDADAMKAMIDGVTICDEHFTTKKDIGELFTEKAEEIPDYIKNDSRLLEGYFSISKCQKRTPVEFDNKKHTSNQREMNFEQQRNRATASPYFLVTSGNCLQ